MSIFRRDTILQIVTLFVAATIAAYASLYVFSASVGAQFIQLVNSFANPLAALICAGLALVLWRSFRKTEVLRRVWGLLGLGLLMWGIAEIIFAYYDMTGSEVPVPSLADLLWVPGYLPLFVALYLRYATLRVAPPRWQVVALAVSVLVALIVSVLLVIVPNVNLSEGDPASIALSILYPVGDLLIVLGVGLTVLVLFGGELSRPWLIIALGFVAIAIADSLYYYGYATGLYDSDLIPVTLVTAISDSCYFGGYVLIGLGLFVQARLQRAL